MLPLGSNGCQLPLPHLPCTEAQALSRVWLAEARGGLGIVESSLWAAVPVYLRRLSTALRCAAACTCLPCVLLLTGSCQR